MNKTPNSLTLSECGRQEDLVSYLYNEINSSERADFEQHLTGCDPCRAELKAFQSVRHEMSAWQTGFVPHVELTLTKSRWQAFREFVEMFPVWLRLTTAGAMTAAAAIVVLALAGMSLNFNSTDGLTLAFGRKPLTITRSTNRQTNDPAVVQPVNSQMLTRAEAEKLIQDAVARVQTQSQEEARLQLASLEQKLNAAYQAKLTTATNKLRNEQRVMLANANRPSLREWLFAANEDFESEGKGNAKTN